MLIPACGGGQFPVNGPKDIEARAVIGTPFQMLLTDTTKSPNASIVTAWQLAQLPTDVDRNVLLNPGMGFLDVAAFYGSSQPATALKVKFFGAVKIPGGGDGANQTPEAQFDPNAYAITAFPPIGRGAGALEGYMLIPLYNPQDGTFEQNFGIALDVNDVQNGKTYGAISLNKYLYCPGVSAVFAYTTQANDVKGVLMGRFVG